ncbi:hypothetical protein DL768_002991 [Monosporascus sp. mg162]|nr:hypothetical protein DL768_002991 [Monosporascus sp. mg162]
MGPELGGVRQEQLTATLSDSQEDSYGPSASAESPPTPTIREEEKLRFVGHHHQDEADNLSRGRSPPPRYPYPASEASGSTSFSLASPRPAPPPFSSLYNSASPEDLADHHLQLPPPTSNPLSEAEASSATAAPAYAPLASASSDTRQFEQTGSYQDAVAETKSALPQDVKGGESSSQKGDDPSEPPPAYEEGDSPLLSFTYLMAAAGGTSSIITQVQQGGPNVNAIGDVGADETITMDLRGTRFVLSRDELLTLPEFVLLSLFPNGLFPEGHMGGFSDGDAVQVDVSSLGENSIAQLPASNTSSSIASIAWLFTAHLLRASMIRRFLSNINIHFTDFTSQYDPASLQYMLQFFRSVAQSIPNESSPTSSPEGGAVPIDSLGGRNEDGSKRAGIIVLREDLDFYAIPPRPNITQAEMIEVKRATARALLKQDGIFSGLKRSDEPGTTEAHLIEMLTAGSGFNHDDRWGHRAGEPNKAVVCSLALARLRSDIKGNEMGNNAVGMAQKLLLFWRKPARRCWWEGVSLTDVEGVDGPLKVWIRRLGTEKEFAGVSYEGYPWQMVTISEYTTLLCLPIAVAQNPNCENVLTPPYSPPVPGSGWTARLIATGLTRPRGMVFDSNNNLLVVEQRAGIRRLSFADGGGTCLELTQNTWVLEDERLTHGIALSNDGGTLFFSTPEEVLASSYDAGSATLTGPQHIVVNNMSSTGYSTRTLLMSQRSPGTLLVSHGSRENLDPLARDLSSGLSQIRAFDVSSLPGSPYSYPSTGTLIGWGLRNSVGVGEEPITGGIYSVENSANEIQRDGVDIHQDNPGEELNFHGYPHGLTEHQGGNYGYPDCFALWNTSIPNRGDLEVGDQFTISTSAFSNDSICNENYVSPRLTFPAHTAPLDIKFRPDGSEAYVSFHGSLNRDEPAGYVVSSIAFAGGAPVDPPTSTTSLHSILSNGDLSQCPDACFRPAGLALDAQDRLFMSSDSTGEIYVLVRSEVSASDTGDLW